MAPPKWVFQVGSKFELKDPQNKQLAVAVYNNYKKNGRARALVNKLFVNASFDLKSPGTYSRDLLRIAQVLSLRPVLSLRAVCVKLMCIHTAGLHCQVQARRAPAAFFAGPAAVFP